MNSLGKVGWLAVRQLGLPRFFQQICWKISSHFRCAPACRARAERALARGRGRCGAAGTMLGSVSSDPGSTPGLTVLRGGFQGISLKVEGNPSISRGNPSISRGNPSIPSGNPSIPRGNPSLESLDSKRGSLDSKRGSLDPKRESLDSKIDRIDRIDGIQVDRPGRWDYLESIGSMIATRIRVGGSSWRAATRQLGPPTRNTTGNARVGGLADGFSI